MRTIGAIHFKDTRCIIHRTTLQTGERQDGGMSRFGSSESLIFCTASTLVANQVRISAAETGRTHSLMGIYHDVIIGSTGYGMLIVIDFQLTVVMLATRNDVAHITALYSIVAIILHQLVSSVHILLIVHHRRRGFMMHNELHSLGMRILIECLDVEIRIWSQEIEYLFLHIATPVFPTDVPSFYQDCIETMGCSKVDVTAHIGIVGRMLARWLGMYIVGSIQLHGRIIMGISPLTLTGNHLPPYTYVLHRMNPGGILDLARLIEIENQVGRQHLAGIICNDHSTPRALERSLHVSLHTLCIRGKPRGKSHGLVIQVQMHGWIIYQGSLMQIDVDTIISLQLE